MANAVMNKAEAMVQISSNSRKLAENRKTLETSSAKLSYIQSRFGTNEERMPSDVRAEVYKLKSTMNTISEQNRQLCDSNAYYQKQDAAGNAQLQMALGTISLVLAPYAGFALAGGGTMAGMTGAALSANAGIGLAIGGFDYNEAYTGKNPAKDFLGANTYEDVRVISNLVSGETVIAGASGVQAIENARRADEIGNISQNAKVIDGGYDSIINNIQSKYPQQLIAEGWEDVTNPKMAVNTTSRELFDPKSGLKIRFDKGVDGATGFEAVDHYHIMNPNYTSKKVDYYLDIEGNPVGKGAKASHIIIKGEK